MVVEADHSRIDPALRVDIRRETFERTLQEVRPPNRKRASEVRVGTERDDFG